ncbi:MAG TPA: hypothetical protein VLQ29_05305 [Candidatus Dormibacteraeota bacterium]|nr:hypothetical protein [Candidatus Dormibacteraeota bacterium]
MPALALHSFSKAIEIPARLHNQPLEAWQTSARLTTLLSRFGIRVLGDLQGRKVVDFAREKNCGPKTLYELDLLARRAQSQNGKASCNGHRRGCVHASHTPSHGFSATGGERATAKMQQDAASFAIPESICHFSFSELPITTRLANVVRAIGARSLGDLKGRSAFEMLQYKACGWGTVSEIQQLIERAVSGEFNVAQTEETTAVAELLSLLEQGLAKLPLRDRQFVLARIGAQTGSGRSPAADLLCPSYAEIGRRYGLTRARVHKAFGNTLDSLRKIWGPRVPRLLEVIKWRCLSTICPLTPQLLRKWVGSPAGFSSRPTTRDYLNGFRLSMEAHVRLIAALDKSITCWPETNRKLRRIDDSLDQFDLALAHVVREAGGQITMAEAYRKLSHPEGRDYRRLTIQNFLWMLRSVECTVVEFKDPEVPTVQLRPSNTGVFPGAVPSQNGKSLTARKIHSNLSAIQLLGTKNAFCERHAVARR